MRITLLMLCLLSAMAGTRALCAQTIFDATGGHQEVVPSIPSHTEILSVGVFLNTSFGITRFAYEGRFSVPVQRVDVFEGKPGTVSTRRLTALQITGTGRTVEGTSRNLSFQEITKLKSGCYYVQAVGVGSNPVTMRGQLVPVVKGYAAHLDGAGAKPPTPSSAQGTCDFTLDYQRFSFSYNITDNVANRRDWKLRDRTNPSRELILPSSQGTVTNFSWMDTIAAEEAELVVTSQSNPGGEIGGCVVPTAIPLGKPCAPSGATLSLRGAPTSRSDITIQVTNATAGSAVLIYVASDRGANTLFGCDFLVSGQPLAAFQLVTDSQGMASFTLQNISLANAVTVYLQAVDTFALKLTNGLQVNLGNCP